MKKHSLAPAKSGDLFHRKNDSSLIVRPHDRDDGGIRTNRLIQQMQIKRAIRVHWQKGHLMAVLLQELAVVDVSRMLHSAHDHVLPLRMKRQRAMNRRVIALRPATGENNLF